MIEPEKFDVSREDAGKIHVIAQRASALADANGVDYPLLDADMDITLAHTAFGLNLDELSEADDGNFGHDIFGIRRHIDRETGDFEGAFCPRYTRRQ